MVPVTRLPDLCLLALFRQMTLEDQIGARKVCRRWADLVPEATIKRRKLILLIGESSLKDFEKRIHRALFFERQTQNLLLNDDGSKMYPIQSLTKWNSLRLKSLDQALAKAIPSTFTETTELQVTVLKAILPMADNFVHLLNQWSRQLTTLQLFEGFIDVKCDKTLRLDRAHKQLLDRLFAAINGLSALRKLYLDLRTLTIPHLSIVSQIEELHFYSYCTSTRQFAQMLKHEGEGNRALARIEFTSSDDLPDFQNHFSELSEPLRRCFIRYNSPILDPVSICHQFSGLTSLELYPGRMRSPHCLFTHLAKLHQLVFLNLSINECCFTVSEQEHLMLPQVPSLKALLLDLTETDDFHQQLAKLKIPWTLPNVEVIRFEFRNFRCSECNVDTFEQPSEQAKSCLGKFFDPLRRDCAKLRLIEHEEKPFENMPEEDDMPIDIGIEGLVQQAQLLFQNFRW